MRILYLYTEVMGYLMPIFRALVDDYGAEIHVIHWDKRKNTPYQQDAISGVNYYKRSDYNKKEMEVMAVELMPDIVYVSGWQDIDYLYIVKKMKKLCVPVVVGLDGKWQRTLRKYIGALFVKYILKNICYDYAWVAGPQQYEYAKRIGFMSNEIICDLLSADIELFNDVYYKRNDIPEREYPHKFMFVGRFVKEKNISGLLRAWGKLENIRKDWQLCFIGNGPLKSMIDECRDVEVVDFLHPKELKRKMVGGGCFVLPSIKEPWGVVIHEFAAAGFPIISSDECGAASEFLIHGSNGYVYPFQDDDALFYYMQKIIDSSDKELKSMGDVSHEVAQKITPKSSAMNIVSVIKKRKY